MLLFAVFAKKRVRKREKAGKRRSKRKYESRTCKPNETKPNRTKWNQNKYMLNDEQIAENLNHIQRWSGPCWLKLRIFFMIFSQKYAIFFHFSSVIQEKISKFYFILCNRARHKNIMFLCTCDFVIAPRTSY